MTAPAISGRRWPPHQSGRTFQAVRRSSAPYEAGEAFFWPLRKETVVHIMRGAERLAVQSMARRGRGKSKRLHIGELALTDLAILEALLFRFMDWKSGRCAPTYDDLQAATGHARDTIRAALGRLGAAGIVQWLRRFSVVDGDKGPEVRQAPNAYRFCLTDRLRALLGLLLPALPDDERGRRDGVARERREFTAEDSGLAGAFRRWAAALQPALESSV